MDIGKTIVKCADADASDVHVQAGSIPTCRIDGKLRRLDAPPCQAQEVETFFHSIMRDDQRQALERERYFDFAWQPDDTHRFRVNMYFQRETLSGAFRTLPMTIPPFESLNLPKVVLEMAEDERGIVLLTGKTSSGKSTTLAAMIDHVNATMARKIITIEDPIEFIHHDKKSFVSQRELGPDTHSFSDGLRAAMRQDPDVIFIGELRDYETMVTAIRAADTGHMVFSTVHAASAAQTVQRMVAVFPQAERGLLIQQLAANLQGVIALRLAERMPEKGGGRLPVAEIMRNTPMIRKLVAEERYAEITSAVMSGEIGMQTFDQHLVTLVDGGLIRNREALRLATNPENVASMLKGMRSLTTGGILGEGISPRHSAAQL